MTELEFLLDKIDSINDWVGKVISLLILFSIVIILWEIIRRYIFSAPTSWVHEMSQFVFAAYCIVGAGYTLSRPIIHHVRVDVFYTRFSPRGKAIVDFLTSILFFLFVGVLVWKGWESAWRSLVISEHSSTTWRPPIYPVRFFIPVGTFLLLIQGVVRFIRDVNTAITGR